MDEQKKPVGRPQIYQGWQPEQRDRRRTKPAQRPQEERRKGEYRPLAVTEQSVQGASMSDRSSQPEKRIADQDMVRIPKTDLKKVTQMPLQRPIQREAQQTGKEAMRQSEQHELQQTGKKPMHESEQREAQQMSRKPIRQLEQREAQQMSRKPIRQLEQRELQQTGQKPKHQPEQQEVQQTIQKPKRQSEQWEPQMQQKSVRQPEQRVPQQAEQKKAAAAKRRRDQESEMKMHILWAVFGVLCIALVAAVFYEIILGHGIRETGSERMEEQRQELILDTEERNIEILTPGGELVSEIKERENRRSLPQQTQTELEPETEAQTDAGEVSIQ